MTVPTTTSASEASAGDTADLAAGSTGDGSASRAAASTGETVAETRQRFVRVSYDDPLGAPLLDDLEHEYYTPLYDMSLEAEEIGIHGFTKDLG
jgi:hypothetical protein